jgi:prephenate dehydrogenase
MPEFHSVGIVGLGLMGGAVARALDALQPRPRILAYDTDAAALETALQERIIDEAAAPDLMLPRCDLVFLCINPSALIRFIERWAASFKSGALITDIAGIKENICKAAERLLLARPDLDFIPGHPMAGAERGGFANSGTVHFEGKNYILSPLERNRPENLASFKQLLRSMGFDRITETSAADHDSKIAFTSQLCHVIAAALIDCEADTEITRYGGGSFEDLTRIAILNAPMWTELFLENAGRLISRIEQFEKSLDDLKALIGAADGPGLEERLAAVRERRSKM